MKRSKSADPAHDVLGYERQQLDAIFRPEAVAVVGATDRPGSVGRTILWNLISNPFGGTVFPVNPKPAERAGDQGLPERLARCPSGRPGGHRHARARRCRTSSASASRPACEGAIIISAGFKETGPEGVELERRVLEEARRGRMRIIGPELPGRDEPADGPQRHLRRRHGPARQRRLPQPERRAAARPSSTGASWRTSASQRLRLASARCSTSAGAT